MLTREAAGSLLTHAGPEIGVASTKAFTAQLVALSLLALHLGRLRGTLSPEACREHLAQLTRVPHLMELALEREREVEELSRALSHARDFLYLGRGVNYPIALEGALKLKEISYLHAEGYPAGEMKHGPIALVDEDLPVVALCPAGRVYEKMLSNVQEAKARGGRVIAVASAGDDALAAAARRAGRRAPRDPAVPGAVVAVPHRDPPAAARLPRGAAGGEGRGPAPQPRQVGHRRVGSALVIQSSPVLAGLNDAAARGRGRGRGPRPHPRRRRQRQDAGHHPPRRPPRPRPRGRLGPHPRRHLHEQGGGGDALPRRGAPRRPAAARLDVHLPQLLRAPAAARGGGGRPRLRASSSTTRTTSWPRCARRCGRSTSRRSCTRRAACSAASPRARTRRGRTRTTTATARTSPAG